MSQPRGITAPVMTSKQSVCGGEGEHGCAGGLDSGHAEPPAALGTARERDAVHRHAIEWRRIALGAQRRAQDAAGAGGERDPFVRHRRDGGGDRRFSLGGRQHATARVSPACRGP